MKALDVLKMAFSALKSRKLRAGLTILGVVIGTSIIVVLIAQTEGLREAVVGSIAKTGVNSVLITAQARGVRLSQTDVVKLQGFSGVRNVVPFIRGGAVLYAGGSSVSVVVLGIDNDYLPLIFVDIEVMDGQLLSKYDYVGLVLGYGVAFPPEASTAFAYVGQNIVLQTSVSVRGSLTTINRNFKVNAVLSSYGLALFTSVDDTVFISLAAANTLFGRGYFYDGIIVVTENIEVVQSVVDSIQQVYGNNVRVVSPLTILEQLESILGSVEFFLGSIAAISLVVAGVGIANVMYISVLERTRVIGLLKALGAKSGTVMALFLAEASLIGVIGGILGTVVGVVLSYTMGSLWGNLMGGMRTRSGGIAMGPPANFSFEMNPVFTPELILASIGFAVAVSVLAGLYPAMKASKLEAATALRHE